MPIDEDGPQWYWGTCRACHKKGNLNVDDGYCGDCN
jgi:hypothetical protein